MPNVPKEVRSPNRESLAEQELAIVYSSVPQASAGRNLGIGFIGGFLLAAALFYALQVYQSQGQNTFQDGIGQFTALKLLKFGQDTQLTMQFTNLLDTPLEIGAIRGMEFGTLNSTLISSNGASCTATTTPDGPVGIPVTSNPPDAFQPRLPVPAGSTVSFVLPFSCRNLVAADNTLALTGSFAVYQDDEPRVVTVPLSGISLQPGVSN